MTCERCGQTLTDYGWHTTPCSGNTPPSQLGGQWPSDTRPAPKIKAKYTQGNLVFDLEADSVAGIFEQVDEIKATERKSQLDHARQLGAELKYALAAEQSPYRPWCCFAHQRKGFVDGTPCSAFVEVPVSPGAILC